MLLGVMIAYTAYAVQYPLGYFLFLALALAARRFLFGPSNHFALSSSSAVSAITFGIIFR